MRHSGGTGLIRELGSGGMGVVWLAEDLALERPAALKLIRPEHGADTVFRERFLREAKLAASLEHPHVLPVYETGEIDGHLFLAMRFVDGYDLATVLRAEGRIEPHRAARLLNQVASALDAAHKAGLVHRDVKPANILIASEEDGEHAYLGDFGLTVRTSSPSELTATGSFVGTLSYAAPEQIRGEPLDARTDVYALGCVLYQALTGTPPYVRASDTAVLAAHLHDAPPRPADGEGGGVPRAFDAIVARALAKDPDERHQSAGALGRVALLAADDEHAETAPPVPIAPPPPRAASSVRRGLVPLTLAFMAAVLGGVAIAAGAPWRDGDASSTSAGARPTDAARDVAATLHEVCADVNAENAAASRRYARLDRALDRGAISLRSGLSTELDQQLRTGDDLLARLDSLVVGDDAGRSVQATTSATWARSLDRLRDERDALERARSRTAVRRAARVLTRSASERDRRRIRSGLLRLGGDACELDPIARRPPILIGGAMSRRRSSAPRSGMPRPSRGLIPCRCLLPNCRRDDPDQAGRRRSAGVTSSSSSAMRASCARFAFWGRSPRPRRWAISRRWVLTAGRLRWIASAISWFVAGAASAPPSCTGRQRATSTRRCAGESSTRLRTRSGTAVPSCSCRSGSRNVSTVDPTRTRSPGRSRRRPSTRSPLRKVPLRDSPSSTTSRWPRRQTSSACSRDTWSSQGSDTSQVPSRPISAVSLPSVRMRWPSGAR